MKDRQKTSTLFLFIFICALFFSLSACGGGSNSSQENSSDTGSMILALQWESSPTTGLRTAQPPSGNVCVDFEIKTINVKVLNASSTEVASGSWPCADRTGTLSGVPADSNLRVVVDGFVADAILWNGEVTDFSISSGERKEIQVTMTYKGDDQTSPAIESTNLSASAVDAPIDSIVTATFTEKIVPASINTTTFTLATAAGPVSGSVAYNPDEMKATFTPDEPLNYNTVYTVTISDNVMDIAGRTMDSSSSWTFSTAKIMWLIIDGAIKKFSTAQEELAVIDSVNCRPLSQYTQMAVDPNDFSLWISESNQNRLMKVDDMGQLLFVIEQWSSHGTVVDPRDSSAWTSKLYQNPDYNRTMVNYSPLGFKLRETAGGLDSSMMDNAMGWNASDNSIWFANYNTEVVKLMNTESLNGYDASGPSGTNHLRMGGFGGQPFEVSVFSGSPSSTNVPCVYVADRGGNVVQFAADGTENWRIDPAGVGEVRFISADPTDGSVWIGGTGNPWRVAKYAYDGSLLVQAVALEYFDTIEADPMDGGVWVGGREALIRMDANGNELWRVAGRVMSIAFNMYPSSRDDIYVDATSNDNSGNGSPSKPYQSIGRALEGADKGSTIFVAPGTYNEDVILKSNVNIIGAGADTTTIRGLGRKHVVEGIDIANVLVSGFTITGAGDATSGINIDIGKNIILRNNIIRENGDSTTSNGITLMNATEALIEKNIITGNANGGIVIQNEAAAIVRNNIISHNGDEGIYRGYSHRVSYIINNVIDHNGNNDYGRSGILTGGSDIISNNIITNNGSDNPNAGLSVGINVFEPLLDYTPAPILSYNNVWNNYQGSYTGITAGSGDISEDPQFEDPTNGVYKLKPGSTCINTGDPDLKNPDCTQSDRGAYGGAYGNW